MAQRGDGRSRTRLYWIWVGVRARCRTPSNSVYRHYGGRGITYDPAWDRFEAFRDWSLGNGYREGLELDRIDGDGNYEPSNCRWVTRTQNMRNLRSHRWIEAFGERKILSEWPEDGRCVVSVSTLWARLNRGEDPESAITRPA